MHSHYGMFLPRLFGLDLARHMQETGTMLLAWSATDTWLLKASAGRGWIAVALVVFATWKPTRLLLGAYLFGGVTMAQFALQGAGVNVSSQLLAMLPYLATIVVLAVISRNPTWIRLNMPASLGKPFHPGT